jgi:hypothetical protein
MKADNKKLVIGIIIVLVVLGIGYVSYTFYRSLQNGLVADYVNKKTAELSGKELVTVETKKVITGKAILDGYQGKKYPAKSSTVCGTFYFNGNFDAEKKDCNVYLWQILFVGRQ